jgi:O-antigen/teichoic acid export membrane protein
MLARYRAHAISGVKWTGGSTAVGMTLQLFQMAVLARYLSTEAFGLFGESMVVVGIALSFADLGLSPALVQREEVSDEVISSLFWTVSGVSVLAGLAVYSASGWIATFFGEIELIPLVSASACFVALFGVGQIPNAVLQRHLAFDRLSKVDIISGCFGVAVAISCAVKGLGAHAPIYGLVVSGGVRLVGLTISAWSWWRPSFHLQTREVRSFLVFGSYQTGERIVNYLAANLDFVMIGRYLGTAALGPYYVAYQVVVQPMLRLNPILTRVAFPLFSRTQSDDDEIGAGYLRIERLIAFVALPLLVGMAVVAPSFFPIYLGNGWSEAILIGQILVPVSILKCLGNPMGSAFLAKGRPDIGFGLNGIRFLLNALLFWWAVQSGLKAVALVYVGSSLLAFWAGHICLSRVIPVGLGNVIRTIIPATFMATAMGIVVALAQLGLSGIRIDPIHRLVFLISLGGTVYAILAFKLERPLLMDIRRWVLEKRGDVD